MKAVLLLALLAISCVASFAAHHARAHQQMALDDALIHKVNSGKYGWKAGRNAKFEGMTAEEAKRFLNSKGVSEEAKFKYFTEETAEAVPATFDSRQQWPTCVHPIRDQQQCGSCWAFGASESLSDRFCIASNGTVNVVLSPEDLVSCDTTNMGCDGGYLDAAWQYMEQTGIVSDACFPYTAGSGTAPACRKTCTTSGQVYKKYKATSIVTPSTAAAMQTEIMNNGPIEVAFTVYNDFMSYKSGVYHHVSGAELGGHAVKAVGWGVDSTGVKYWIIANSWGTSWGIDGFFWIRRGVDECGIEDNAIAGRAVV